MFKKITKYDKKGNLIYKRNFWGYEQWYEYDKNNNTIYYKYFYKDSIEEEIWKEYDKNDNCIYYKNSNGWERWYEYDENNNRINIREQEYKEIEFGKKGVKVKDNKKTNKNLINQLQVGLAEQKEELNKITKKCNRLSKSNKKLKKESEELEKRIKKLNKCSRFELIDI